MKIYFSGSIRGGGHDNKKTTYLHIIAGLKEAGFEVVSETAFTSSADPLTDSEIHDRDIAWIDEADIVIADITHHSFGVGYEVAYALYKRIIPVLAFVDHYAQDISAMASKLPTQHYEDNAHYLRIVLQTLTKELLRRENLLRGRENER